MQVTHHTCNSGQLQHHSTPFSYVAAYPCVPLRTSRNDCLVWLDWSSFPHSSPNWFGGNSAGHEESSLRTRGKSGARGRAHQSRMSPHSSSILFTMGCPPEKVIFIGRVQEKRGKMGVKWVHFPAEWCSAACSHSLLSPPCSGYGPQGENHWAVRIRVQIRYTVKTLGPLGTKLD